MPRKSSVPSLADSNAAEGGVASVDRALSLLTAFSPATPLLTLGECASRTQLHKSTALRMLASLEHAGLIQHRADGHYALGSAVARLHHIYTQSFSMEAVAMPVLRELSGITQESAALHVQQGEHRLCLHRVDSPRPVRDHLKAGDLLPPDRGAGGRVIQAFSGKPGAMYDQIRKDFVVILVGDRVPELAGIASPVFKAGGELVGALTLTMPSERLVKSYNKEVQRCARKLSMLLGGDYPERGR